MAKYKLTLTYKKEYTVDVEADKNASGQELQDLAFEVVDEWEEGEEFFYDFDSTELD